MESIIATFHIDWKIIIAQAVNFGIVFAVLYWFALKPLAVLMLKRTEKIVKGLADAKKNEEMLGKTKSEYDAAMTKVRIEAQKFFEDGKKETAAKQVAMMEEAKREVAGILESGRKNLEAEKAKLVADVKKETVPLVLQIVEKILGEKVDSKYEDKVLKELKNF